MSIKTYIWGLLVSTLIAAAAWVFVIVYIDPEESGAVGQVFFYTSLFLFLSGVLVTIFVWLRKRFMGENVASETIGLSFRQGSLLAIFLVIIVVLLGFEFLVWWNGLLVLAGIFLVEFYFLSRENK